MTGDLTIGALAKWSGVNVETIRYYQRRGLLRQPSKPPSGFRRYSLNAVKQVRFIMRAQALGFTLEEIAGLLRLEEGKACAQTRQIAAQKLTLIEQKVSDLARMKKALARLVRACDASAEGEACPIIHLLIQNE